MKVVLVVNPRSGRGSGGRVGARLEGAIAGAGLGCVRLDVAPDLEERLPGALRDADALVVAGGDGTVHHAARAAMDAGVPIYHAPLGTENLVARQFGMTREPQDVLAALERRRTLRVDAGETDGRVFLVMCSLGADASIIHRLHAERKGSISRLSYAPHIVAEAIHPSLPELTVVADGREVVSKRRGLLIVANSRQYAARLDPAADASMSDGLLDVLFMPATNTLALALWALRCWARTAGEHPKSVAARAERVEVAWSGDAPPAQIDGEAFDLAGDRLVLRAMARALPVLLPPGVEVGPDAGTVGGAAARAGKEGADADETSLSGDDGRRDGGAGAGGGRDAQPAAHR